MTTATDERTVVVTVKEAAKQANRGDFPPDYKLIVEAPWFQSQQPTVIYVPLDVGVGIEPGDTLSMVIRPKGLKDHGDTPYDGQQPWMYHWQYVRLASTEPSNGAAEPENAATWKPHLATDADAAARKRDALAPDPKGNSIERQGAAKAATAITPACFQIAKPYDWDAVWDDAANHIIGWLQGTPPDTGAGHLVQAARDMGAIDSPEATDTEHGAMEPGIDETQAPSDADGLPF